MTKPRTFNGNLANLPAALEPMVAIDHWVVWRWRRAKNGWTKPPFKAALPSQNATNNDPATWASYQDAVEALHGKALLDGIGFALPDTKFDVVDLDHCRDPDSGEVDAWARKWLDAANGTYVEVTPSGEGLRIIGLGEGEKAHRKFKVAGARKDAAVEIYRNCERYITVTGLQVGSASALCKTNGLLERIEATYKNGAKSGDKDFNRAGKQGGIDYDDAIRNGAPAGSDASAVFHSVVGHLHAKGMSIDEIVDELGQWINGIGGRYAGRLRQEVERSFGKWGEKARIEAPTTEPDEPQAWDGKNKRGKPYPTRTNTRRALRALGVECSYDVFHDRLLVTGKGLNYDQRTNLDHIALALCVKTLKAFGFEPSKLVMVDAIIQLCIKNKFDSILDYLDGLQWDGVPRLDKWVVTYLGAEDTELNREFGRLVMIAAVRRVRRPGCKFDFIVVLEGPMGTQKSKAIETLAGVENFSDQTILGARDREQQELLAGVWLYEIAELSNIRKTEVEHIKAFASRTHDRARPAYGRTREDKPRRCVLFATTNNDRYLKEADRRFWPIKTATIDIEALRRDRDQLWAEAAAQEPGAKLGLRQDLWNAARVEQEEREEADPWDDKLVQIEGTFQEGEERVYSADILEIVLGMHVSRQRDVDAKRLGRCMRRLGWSGPKKIRIGGTEGKGYARSDPNWGTGGTG
jgi:hypothetical protein